MGGTIFGHHFDKGKKSTICISDFLHYFITFGLKTWKVQLKGTTLAKFMGGTIWRCHFDQNSKHNNWYYWNLSLFQYVLLKNMKKREMQDDNDKTTKNTILRGHEQALARSWPKNNKQILDLSFW